LLVFTGKNLFRTLDSKNIKTSFARDTVWRFLNSAHFNWRKFLFLISSSRIEEAGLSRGNLKYLVDKGSLVRLLYEAIIDDVQNSEYLYGYML
jgi:hypothetical protein